MKTIKPGYRPAMHTIFVLLILVLAQSNLRANTLSAQHKNDSILINKILTSKKYKVKIFSGVTGEVLFFGANGEDGKVYQFFMFDLDGNLVKQTQIRNKQTTMLTNFNKGCYTFEVFSDDEHIENGTLTIK
jgi:hypothetical protein